MPGRGANDATERYFFAGFLGRTERILISSLRFRLGWQLQSVPPSNFSITHSTPAPLPFGCDFARIALSSLSKDCEPTFCQLGFFRVDFIFWG